MPLNFIKSLSILEICLIQIILYSLLWFYNEYVATLLTFVIVPIFLGILFISVVSDRIEASRVGKKYYIAMVSSMLIPIIVAIFFYWAYQGVFDFLEL